MFIDWRSLLTNEAISNYIVFFAGILIGVIGFLISRWISRKRPSMILFEKTEVASLLDVEPQVHNLLQITFENKRVKEFYQTTFSIYNNGEIPLENIELVVPFNELPDIFSTVLDDSSRNSVRETAVITQQTSVHLKIPYLNPKKENQDFERIIIYSSKPLKVLHPKGSGVGWNVKYIDRVARRKEFEEVLSKSSSAAELLVNSFVLFLRRSR